MTDFRDVAEHREHNEGVHDDASDTQHLSEQLHAEALRSPGKPNDWGRTGPGERSVEPCAEGEPPAGPTDLTPRPSTALSTAGAPSPSAEDLERRRSTQSYFAAGLPWTGEFADLVEEGLVDVS